MLNTEDLYSLPEAKLVIAQWFHQYNHIRSHQSLDHRPPLPETIASTLSQTLVHTGGLDTAVTERSAQHAILAYGVRSLLVEKVNAIDQLRASLSKEFGDSHPGKSFFDNWDAASAGAKDLDAVVRAIMRRCIASDRPAPDLIFLAGLRLLTWVTQSPFKSVLIPHLKPWLRAHWRRILRTQRFLLHSPASTVPPIKEVLKSELEAEQFAASLTLVAAVAVRTPLSAPLRQDVEHLAQGTSS